MDIFCRFSNDHFSPVLQPSISSLRIRSPPPRTNFSVDSSSESCVSSDNSNLGTRLDLARNNISDGFHCHNSEFESASICASPTLKSIGLEGECLSTARIRALYAASHAHRNRSVSHHCACAPLIDACAITIRSPSVLFCHACLRC